MKNSVSGYREARKRDKARIELATRANDPIIRDLLVRCLNDYQETVARAQADPQNSAVMATLHQQGKIHYEMVRLQAKSVKDKYDLGSNEIVKTPRSRKPPPRRYTDDDYHDDGRSKTSTTEERTEGESEDDSADDAEDTSPPGSDDGSNYVPESDEDDNYDRFDPSGSDDDWDPDFDDWSAEQKSSYSEMMAKRTAMRSEIQQDEGIRRLQTKLQLDGSKRYTLDDLHKEDILKRALDLAYCARQGMDYDNPPSIHIAVNIQKYVFSGL